MSSFAEATTVTPIREGVYRSTLDPEWAFRDKPHGGYTMATLTRAALTAAGRRHPLVASAHFLRPPEIGDVELHTEVCKRGQRFTTVRARMLQGGKTCVEATVGGSELTDADHEWTRSEQPGIKPLDECYAGKQEQFALRRHMDLRLDPETTGFLRGEPAGVGEQRGWLAMRDGTTFDPLSLIVAVDALPPVALDLGHVGWCPTVELTYQLRSLPAPGWLTVHVHGDAVTADGWFNEDAAVYDARGRLVAQSRQLGLAGNALGAG